MKDHTSNAKMIVAVVGAGLIGSSWAALFAAVGGHQIRLWDPNPAALDQARALITVFQEQLQRLYPLADGAIACVDRIEDAVAGAQWIQENAPERLNLKRDLYHQIEAAAPAESVIASSTSALLWSDLAKDLRQPARFITAHPFNPPHLMPLVELYGSAPEAIDCAITFFHALDRVPVVLKRESAGHIAGRLSAALWREAVSLVAEGVASVGDVDLALTNGPGLRWATVGVHMGYHLGGGSGGIADYLKKLGPSQEHRWASLGNPSLTPDVRAMLSEGIREAAAGRSVAEISKRRDQLLMAILESRQGTAS